MFKNRQQAGVLLAKSVQEVLGEKTNFDPRNTLVLGLPRGGVLVALEIALTLSCPLDVLVAKKIGAPDQPELALGAVSSDGTVVMNDALKSYLATVSDYINTQREYLVAKTKESENGWRQSAGLKTPCSLHNKRVIVVDDGVATGMTAIAAARSVHRSGAQELILATPVISKSAYDVLQAEYDSIIALDVPYNFGAIGEFYLDFHQVENDEVVAALEKVIGKDQNLLPNHEA